jgi:hypothetical protein
MSPHTQSPIAPTPKQMSYLKALAEQTGTSFTVPKTRREAGSEIERLKSLKASRGTYVEMPRTPHAAEQPYATEQKPGEVSGYGSTASRRTPAPEHPAPARGKADGEPLELARYTTKSGERRALYGIRVDRKPRIIDAAAEGTGRVYTVETDLHEEGGAGEVKALVEDYIARARELGGIPMARSPRRGPGQAASDA